ncbi:MAG: dTDP-4-amino-4,6-dideoxygalactose transaminase [Chloroflexi bacterium]|nr:MAG: dTDP-4-amino-4,6-dideoxygalactose transaminase [Chloroflexota bacterium]
MEPPAPIPLNRVSLTGAELGNLETALNGGHLGADGPFTRRCEALLEEMLGGGRVLLTTSGTHALELAALLLDVAPGDEVVVPAFSFPSTASAFALRGARPVFCDIRPDTLNLDEARLEALLGGRTRAVVPVHYAGIGCEMEAITAAADRRGTSVVEDAALGLGGRRHGQALGRLGRLSALSFHATKAAGCGVGGALVVNDPGLVERAEVLRDRGTDRARMLRGEVGPYTWQEPGSSWAPSDLLAAVLCAQLEALSALLGRRRRIWERYQEALATWAEERGVRLPAAPPGCIPAWTVFWLLLPDPGRRAGLIDRLAARGVEAAVHYQPLHLSPAGRRLGGRPGDCPVTEGVCERLLRLPLHAELGDEDVERIVAALVEGW